MGSQLDFERLGELGRHAGGEVFLAEMEHRTEIVKCRMWSETGNRTVDGIKIAQRQRDRDN